MELITWCTLSYNLPYVFVLMLGTAFAAGQVFFGFVPNGIDVNTDVDNHSSADNANLLHWAGVGKAPLTILMSMFLMAFGSIGLSVSYTLSFVFGLALVGTWHAWGWVGVVGLLAARFTGLTARFINRILPTEKTTVDGDSGGVQKIGIALTDIDGIGGQFQFEGRYLFCFSVTGGIIKKGEQVVVVSYDSKRMSYQVKHAQD